MTFPKVPAPAEVASHFVNALKKAGIEENPYRRWILKDTLPEDMCVGVLLLPIRPPDIAEWGGVRDLGENNRKRTFFTPEVQKDFPAVKAFVEAFSGLTSRDKFRRPEPAADELEGSFLRIEYMQDLDGMWLKPHPDITANFSMVIYLCTGPETRRTGARTFTTPTGNGWRAALPISAER